MHPAPSSGENRRLGIKLLESQRDSRGIDDRLAAFEHDRRHHYLPRGDQQFLALQVVNLDDFEVDALERQQLAHLGSEWAAEKLVQLCRHYRAPMLFNPLLASARKISSRSSPEIESRTTSAAARSAAGALWHSASTFMPARCAASIPARVSSTAMHSSPRSGSRSRRASP